MSGFGVYSDIVLAVTILLIFMVLAKVIYFFLKKVVVIWTKKTKTTLDDEILKALEKPIYIGVIVAGLYFALIQISALAAYFSEIRLVFIAMSILIVAFLVTGIINAVFRWYNREISLKTGTGFDNQFLPIIKKIINGFILAIALILILKEVFNIEITPLIASLGIAGLAIALALQDTLSNFFAGVYIVADRPVRIGDFIELENGMQGFVEDIGWRSTRIKTLSNNIVVIPNSKLSQSIITNFHLPEKEMTIVIPCGVSYNSDLKKVEEVTIEVGKEIQNTIPGAVKDFIPFIRYNEFGDSNIKFSVFLRVNSFTDKFLITHEFIKRLSDRYGKEKIEISYPWTNVCLRKF